jgi:hypothetical protein
MDAAKRYVYNPTMLNGQAAEVLTDVEIAFRLNLTAGWMPKVSVLRDRKTALPECGFLFLLASNPGRVRVIRNSQDPGRYRSWSHVPEGA